MRFPTTWGESFGEDVKSASLSRTFGFPDGVEAGDILWLELRLGIEGWVELNGRWVGDLAAGTVRLDVTEYLMARNKIRLDFHRPTTGELSVTIAEVALLIEGLKGEG